LRLVLTWAIRLPKRTEVGETEANNLALHICGQVFNLDLQLAVRRLLILAKIRTFGDISELD
jgi:hypothetical protein